MYVFFQKLDTILSEIEHGKLIASNSKCLWGKIFFLCFFFQIFIYKKS